MSLFSSKKEVNLEGFCRDYYEITIFDLSIHGIDIGESYFDNVKKSFLETEQIISNLTSKNLASEITPLWFELFALAWMHKFPGKFDINQSVFTKSFLHEKQRDDIWADMAVYNNAIDGATLDWLFNLGTINSNFWLRTRQELSAANIQEAKKMKFNIDECVSRVNNRLCSENAWHEEYIPKVLIRVLCEKLSLNPDEPNQESISHLSEIISKFYDGALKSMSEIKIKK
jgi:hypothetical protein